MKPSSQADRAHGDPALVEAVIDEEHREVRICTVGDPHAWTDDQWLQAMRDADPLAEKWSARGYKVLR